VQIARRLYIYFIAAVSLAMLAVGLMSLLRIGLEQIAIALGWSEVILEPGEAIRRQVSLWAAVSIVALPVWLLHWWLAERAALRPDAEGEAERGSTVRALYLSAVLAGSFLAAFFAGTTLVQRMLGEVWTRRGRPAVSPARWPSSWFPRASGSTTQVCDGAMPPRWRCGAQPPGRRGSTATRRPSSERSSFSLSWVRSSG